MVFSSPAKDAYSQVWKLLWIFVMTLCLKMCLCFASVSQRDRLWTLLVLITKTQKARDNKKLYLCQRIENMSSGGIFFPFSCRRSDIPVQKLH